MPITIRSNKRRVVWIEPEGADFWMLPEQTFKLRAEATSAEDRFELWDGGDSLQVFSVGVTSPSSAAGRSLSADTKPLIQVLTTAIRG